MRSFSTRWHGSGLSLRPSYSIRGVGAGWPTEIPCSYICIYDWYCHIDPDELNNNDQEKLDRPHDSVEDVGYDIKSAAIFQSLRCFPADSYVSYRCNRKLMISAFAS